MIEPRPVHTIVFDLDDTLYPERDFVLSGFAAVDAWLRETHGAQKFAETAGELYTAGHRGKIFDEALPSIGVEPTPKLVAKLVAVYRAHEPKLKLFPDAAEILGWATTQFRLALITDGYAEVQIRKIRALGLESIISCRIITDELGRAHWKPSPEPYRRVMAQYPGPTDGYVYVADNPRKDFIGAKQLGWRTVRARRPGGEHADYVPTAAEAPDEEIASLLSLRQLLSPGDDGPQTAEDREGRRTTDGAG
jgi:putative hydrolase of the HAD superfamily